MMKNLKQYIEEKLIVKNHKNAYSYKPTTWNELRQIIDDIYEEQGPGTKQVPINFNDIDVSGINSFYNDNSKYEGIFAYTQFKYIDISDWNVSNIKDMRGMFKECNWLKSVGDLSNWDVSNVNNMGALFYECKNLESIGDISNWDVSKTWNMATMFRGCKKLKSVGDLSNWDISNIKNMGRMFYNSEIQNIPDWYEE